MIFYNGKLCSLVFRYGDFVGNAPSNATVKFSVIRGFTIQTTLTYNNKNILRLYLVYNSPFLREDFSVVGQEVATSHSCPHTRFTV